MGMPSKQHAAIRTVAYFEAFKGGIVLIAATGLLSLVHSDVYLAAAKLIEHTHLNPASKFPQILLNAVERLDDTRLWLLAGGALLYSAIRFIEAYGLYFERAWAEVVAALSGAVYVPFEVIALVHRPTLHGATLLALNALVIAVMLYALAQRRRNSIRSRTIGVTERLDP